jgi:choice-of-anchor C domain-containing protein
MRVLTAIAVGVFLLFAAALTARSSDRPRPLVPAPQRDRAHQHASDGNLLVNGSFEQGVDPGGDTDLFPLSQNIAGWIVAGGSIGYEGSGGWMAEDGVRSLDMDGLNPGTVEQTFTTFPTAHYLGTFWLAGNPDRPGKAKKHLLVAIVNALNAFDAEQTYTFSVKGTSRSNMDWKQEAFQFTATSAASTIVFVSQDPLDSGRGAAIDNVSVVQTSAKRF